MICTACEQQEVVVLEANATDGRIKLDEFDVCEACGADLVEAIDADDIDPCQKADLPSGSAWSVGTAFGAAGGWR